MRAFEKILRNYGRLNVTGEKEEKMYIFRARGRVRKSRALKKVVRPGGRYSFIFDVITGASVKNAVPFDETCVFDLVFFSTRRDFSARDN